VVQKTHGESGLTEQCRQSKITMEAAEQQILHFVKRHCRQGRVRKSGVKCCTAAQLQHQAHCSLNVDNLRTAASARHNLRTAASARHHLCCASAFPQTGWDSGMKDLCSLY
jgi:hypothetical protein